MASLEDTRNAIARVNTGKNANEDSWMTMWCRTNWGDLLQPAPLSIALLGSIMVISASTDDFSLVSTDDAVPYKWKYAEFPGSFKACLMQMVREGYTGFGTAHTSMTRIRDASSQLPDLIKASVYTIVEGNPDEVKVLLHDQIQAALDLANTCAMAARESEKAFHGIQNLAGELVVACTNQVGTSEQKLKANQTQLAILDKRKESEQERVKVAKETHELMKKAFGSAENDFHEAIKNVPTGWDLVGMQAVESLTQLVVSAGNAVVGALTLEQQAVMAGMGMLRQTAGLDGRKDNDIESHTGRGAVPDNSPRNTQTNAANITDPAILEVHRTFPLVNALRLLVSGGPNGAPDWDRIRGTGTDNANSGGLYVQLSLSTIAERLDPAKPISAQLLPIVELGVTIAKGIIAVAGSAQGSEDSSLDRYKSQVITLVSDIQLLKTKVDLILQQPGTVGSGPATPPTPHKSRTSSSAAQQAVENAKFLVDETRSHLEASRDAYTAATSQLLEQQEQISKTIAQLTSLSLTNAGIKAMLPILKQAVGAFTTLQAQFSQITQFFEGVASLLGNILQPSVQTLAKTMENTAKLGGVTIGDLARRLMYTQMMLPLKVGMLAEKIASVYIQVSNNYILPAQRSVGSMMEFTDDDSPEGRASLRASLEKKQRELQEKSTQSSKEIAELVSADQKRFARDIDARLSSIETALQHVLPAVTQPVPKQIEDVVKDHVEQYTQKRQEARKENPMYNTEDLA